MVLCVVVGYSKRSGHVEDVSIYKIPKIFINGREEARIFSEKRRSGFVAAMYPSLILATAKA